MDLLTAISQLNTFDHAACDAALRNAKIEVWGVRLHTVSGDVNNYVLTAFVILWTVSTSLSAAEVWRGRNLGGGRWGNRPAPLWQKLLVLGFPAVGAYGIVAQATAIINYVEACRAVLHAS